MCILQFFSSLYATSLPSHRQGQPGISVAYRAPTILFKFDLLAFFLEGICCRLLVPSDLFGVVDL